MNATTADTVGNVRMMSRKQLVDKMLEYYGASLTEVHQLKQIQASAFPEFVTKGGNNARLRPTLYELLIYNAIDGLLNEEFYVDRFDEGFVPDSPVLFAPASDFVNHGFYRGTDGGTQFQGVQLLQQVMSFRMSRANETEALLDADLSRLMLMRQIFKGENGDSLYRDAIERLLLQARKFPIYSTLLFEKAVLLTQMSGDGDLKKIYNIYQLGYQLYPQSSGGVLCKKAMDDMTRKSASFEKEDVYHPSLSQWIHVSYRNINQVYGIVLKVENSLDVQFRSTHLEVDTLLQLLKKLPVVATFQKSLPHGSDLKVHSADIELPRLSAGRCLLILSDKQKPGRKDNLLNYTYLQVSALSATVFAQAYAVDSTVIMDRQTGLPLAGVSVTPVFPQWDYQSRQSKLQTGDPIITDAAGVVKLSFPNSNSNFRLWMKMGNDEVLSESFYSGDSYYLNEDIQRLQLFIFTDRAIYRPGQPLHYKAVLMDTNGEKARVLRNKKVQIAFRDANGNSIQTHDLVTNDFGSCSGSFHIPVGLLNGMWSLSATNGSHSVLVEEYKRPKFKVELLQPQGVYRLGDTITIRGTVSAFSGVPLNGAVVKYKVVRQESSFGIYRGYYPRQQKSIELQNGSLVVDEKGEFSWNMPLMPVTGVIDELLHYHVSVDVVDLNGETQSAELDLNAARRGRQLAVQMPSHFVLHPDNVLKAELKIHNQSNQPVAGNGLFRLYRMVNKSELKPGAYWQKPDTILGSGTTLAYPNSLNDTEEVLVENGLFSANGSISVAFKTENLKAGNYWADFELIDHPNDSSKVIIPISVVELKNLPSTHAKPLVLQLYGAESAGKGNIGVFVESGLKDASCLLTVTSDKKLLVRKRLTLTNEQQWLVLPFTSEFPVTINVQASVIHGNRLYSEQDNLMVDGASRKLAVKVNHFRDKSAPGNQETVKLTISGPDGDKTAAELLAGMYDASLDEFLPHSWAMDVFFTRYRQPVRVSSDAFRASFGSGIDGYPYPTYPDIDLTYHSLNWYDLIGYGGGGIKGMLDMRMKSVANSIEIVEDKEETPAFMMVEEAVPATQQQAVAPAEPQKPDEPSSGGIQVRRDLRETAFFYPHLTTDVNGDVSFSFTVPESLTRWKLMGLAHNEKGFVGQLMQFMTTSKELMVVPEVPRFFREGDRLVLAAKVVNMTGQQVNAVVEVELLNAITNVPLQIISGAVSQNINIKANGNGLVEWDLTIPQGLEAIVLRVKAQSGTFSDGEEHIVPVLPNRVMVSESVPFQISKKGKYTFHLPALEKLNDKEVEHHRLTFSYTQQPAWEALKALPYLMEYPYECSEQLFSRLFGYAVGRHMLDKNSDMKRVLSQWSVAKSANESPLKSALLKNEALKNLLEEETPWQQAGERESANRERLLLLLDDNSSKEQLSMAISKLQKMQNTDGGWGWFSGMTVSPYITGHIVAGLGQLKRMEASVSSDNRVVQMAKQGTGFLVRELMHRHQQALKDSVKGIDASTLHLLYAISYSSGSNKDKGFAGTVDYWLEQIQQSWTKTNVMEQAMACMVFHRFGNEVMAVKIMQSLRQQGIRQNEQLWFRQRSGWYWMENALETQAVVLEAFAEVAPGDADIAPMQNWLVAQKRVQAWPTTKSTTMAVYGLLTSGSGIMTSPAQPDAVTVGNINLMKLKNVKREAGSGTYSVSWEGAEVKPAMGKVEVKKLSDGPSWGSLKWHYFTPLHKVKATSGDLMVQKFLFVEKVSDGQTQLIPVDKAKVKVGDKIVVRLTIKSLQRMEYVHLKDLRSSLLEPDDVLSGYKYAHGLGYYQEVRDASVNLFIDHLPKGEFVIEYTVRARGKGITNNGFASLECMYAPEYEAKSENIMIEVK
jgi:uncharacterized protein YfaS (alpha-2-macroglobulin family)